MSNVTRLTPGKAREGRAVIRTQPSPAPPGIMPEIRNFLDIEAWAARDIPEPDRLLGDVVTTTSRMFLIGRTGLGKTMLGFALAAGMASGAGFCHWRSSRPARVLYIDGEMPGELIKARAIEALRRAGPIPPGNLTIYARDAEEEFARRFPELPPFAPLNTPEGHEFIYRLIDVLGGVECVIFDNVMSLIAGDQKDEVPWSDTLALVSGLTARRVGQIWLDHTGHNTERQYGSSTKAWRFDAVGVMKGVAGGSTEGELAFSLSFDGADNGKARRRTPDNWQHFETHVFRLKDDAWTSSPASGKQSTGPKLSPVAREFYDALIDALAETTTPGRTTKSAWYSELVRKGLADALEPDDDRAAKAKKQAKLRKYLAEFKTAGLIGVNNEEITRLNAEK